MTKREDKGGSGGTVKTVNGRPVGGKSHKSTGKRRRRRKRARRKDLPAVKKGFQDEVNDVAQAASDKMVEAIADVTVKPIKRLLTPAGIGAAVAVTTKSPVAGLLTAGALSGSGAIVKGLGRFAQALQEQLVIQQAKSDIAEGMKQHNADILDALIELIHNDKLILDEQKLGRLNAERAAFKELERERELTVAEKERDLLLKQLADTMKLVVPEKQQKKGFVEGLFGKFFEGLAFLLGFKLVAGKFIAVGGLAKIMMAVGGGLIKLFTFAIQGLIGVMTKALPKFLAGAWKRFGFLAIAASIYEAIKGGIQGWLEHKNIEGVIAGALGGLINLFTFGLFDKDNITNALYKGIDSITSGIGELFAGAYFAIENAMKSVINYDYASAFTGLVGKFTTWISDKFQQELDTWADILQQLGITKWFENSVNAFQNHIRLIGDRIVSFVEMLLDTVAKVVNILPGVNIALTERQRQQQVEDQIEKLEKERNDVQRRETSKGWLGVGKFTESDRVQRLAEIDSALQQIRPGQRGQSKIAPPTSDQVAEMLINQQTAGKVKATELVVAAHKNQQLKQELELSARHAPVIIQPGPSSIVAAQNTNNFVGPMSKRNNENTYVRAQDRNDPRGMR